MPRKALANPPLQTRSRETLDRICRATEDLLRTRAFDALTVAEIAKKARCPVGSFYARFRSKDDLLPFLYERYDAELKPRMEAEVREVPWQRLSLRETVRLVVDRTVDLYVERKHLLRAVALYARTRPGDIGADVRRLREGVTDLPAKILSRFGSEIAHPDPLEACRIGFFMVAAIGREKILFDEAPHAAATRLSTDALKGELYRMLYTYLTCPA
jgi:AcrR family transcriptional regulator